MFVSASMPVLTGESQLLRSADLSRLSALRNFAGSTNSFLAVPQPRGCIQGVAETLSDPLARLCIRAPSGPPQGLIRGGRPFSHCGVSKCVVRSGVIGDCTVSSRELRIRALSSRVHRESAGILSFFFFFSFRRAFHKIVFAPCRKVTDVPQG